MVPIVDRSVAIVRQVTRRVDVQSIEIGEEVLLLVQRQTVHRYRTDDALATARDVVEQRVVFIVVERILVMNEQCVQLMEAIVGQIGLIQLLNVGSQ